MAIHSAHIANGLGRSIISGVTIDDTGACSHRHGPVSECPISATKEILGEYMALEEDSPKRREMEARYGRVALKKLMDEYEREKDFMDWLERCTGIPCPGCELRVEKHSGCNHVRGEHSRLPGCS